MSVPRLDTGVVVATRVEGAAPGELLAGLPLCLRAVLTLQKVSMARVFVVASPEDVGQIATSIADARVRVPVQVVTAEAGKHPLAALRGIVDRPSLCARFDVVADPGVYRRLRDEGVEGALAVAAVRGDARLGPMIVTPEALEVLGTLEGAPGEDEAWAALGVAGATRTVDVGRAWVASASTDAGRRLAFHELFEACRKPVDGIVSRHLNRHVSLFVSRRIVALPITPNQVSGVTFLIGLAGAASCASGGYVPMLVGALLFQLNSILDGVDGELARVRFQQSKLGEWVDTVCDDVSNVLFYGGVALGASRMPGFEWMSWMGYLASTFGVLTAAMYYTELARLGSGDFYALGWTAPPKGLVGGVVTVVRYLTKKDFFILLFVVMAALGVLPWALPIMLLGTTLTVCAGAVRTVKWVRSSRADRARGASPAS